MRKIILILSLLSVVLLFIVSCKSGKNDEKPLQASKVVVDTLVSKNLNENRMISTYLPKGYLKHKIYPVVYATDGQIIVDSYKKMLDSLMKNKILPKFILVGVHSNEKKVSGSILEYRNYEYVKGLTNKDAELEKLYENHYKFFTQEVIQYIEKKYSVSKNYKHRIFYGVSNGAGFGVSMGAENSNIFKNYICFSMAGGDYKMLNWDKDNYPYFYLSYGDKESESFIAGVKRFEEFLTKNNYKYEHNVFIGGHKREMWKKEFFRILPKILNK